VIPVALDPARLRLAIAGVGATAERRKAQLTRGGAEPVSIDLSAPAFSGIDVVWITGLSDPQAATLAQEARKAGALVNVEDRPELCDFHSVAELRQGALLIGVSTGGESPGLAQRVRDRIAVLLGSEWADRVARLGALRHSWRREGRSIHELARLTNEEIDRAGWLA